ncbi:hypothetical protein VB713_11070 [Anabaena cylindrica UHCC 0172]|uniref:hypothetical protein n=1 Tax=Anabaena cylindrica TaxID=1165 RepID=UPI002B1EF342|nr:hypothetical protein [Anabaena cylindrica]MEA5551514.1 hypothetical protein [Anabaena cylindrica UHCC 0172]
MNRKSKIRDACTVGIAVLSLNYFWNIRQKSGVKLAWFLAFNSELAMSKYL